MTKDKALSLALVLCSKRGLVITKPIIFNLDGHISLPIQGLMGLIGTWAQTHYCLGKELGGRHRKIKDPQVANLNEGLQNGQFSFRWRKIPRKNQFFEIGEEKKNWYNNRHNSQTNGAFSCLFYCSHSRQRARAFFVVVLHFIASHSTHPPTPQSLDVCGSFHSSSSAHSFKEPQTKLAQQRDHSLKKLMMALRQKRLCQAVRTWYEKASFPCWMHSGAATPLLGNATGRSTPVRVWIFPQTRRW